MSLEPFPTTLAALEAQWPTIGQPGDWWTGAERVAMIAEARAAESCSLCADRKAALSPYAVDSEHEAGPELPAAAVDAIHRIVTDPGRLSSQWFEECEEAGMAPPQVIELGGVVSTVTIADTLSRALDRPRLALPDTHPGEPARKLPAGLEIRGAWAPMVVPENAEGIMKMMYENVAERTGFVFNVVRALSSAPSAWSLFLQTFLPNYATDGPMPENALSRVQVELLASSTSEFNDCFY
jgi:hypothetical protein